MNMIAADKTVALDRPVLDWPVTFFLAIVHAGALAALLPELGPPRASLVGSGYDLVAGAGPRSHGSRMEDQASALQARSRRVEDVSALGHA